jgi:hypothetical protein
VRPMGEWLAGHGTEALLPENTLPGFPVRAIRWRVPLSDGILDALEYRAFFFRTP